MRVLCKKCYSQSRCRYCGYNYRLRKIFIIKIIEGEIYDVDFNYVLPHFNPDKNISTDVNLKNGINLCMSENEGKKYFYSPEETVNILRTKLIDEMTNEGI